MRVVRLKPATGPVLEVGVAPVQRGSPDSYLVHLAGEQQEVRWALAADGRGWLVAGGRRHPVVVVRNAAHVQVWIDGRVRTFELLERAARRRRSAAQDAGTEVLSAPMPGTVLRVEVSEGQLFTPHQPLVIMVSMKMEMTLSVPHPGRVREIQCAPGQLVERGAALLLLGEADEAGAAAR